MNRTFLNFEYPVAGLPDLESRDYITRESALAAALCALMKTPTAERLRTKLQAYRRIVSAPLNESKKLMLATVLNRYMPLDASEEIAMGEVFVQDREGRITPYELDINRVYELIREDARYTGLQEGRQVGLQEGQEQGLLEGVLAGKRDTLLRLLEKKFGSLPPLVADQVRTTRNVEELERFLDAVLTANSLAEMGLVTENGSN